MFMDNCAQSRIGLVSYLTFIAAHTDRQTDRALKSMDSILDFALSNEFCPTLSIKMVASEYAFHLFGKYTGQYSLSIASKLLTFLVNTQANIQFVQQIYFWP